MTDETLNFADGNIAWPEKGDLLFTSGDDWWNNACLNRRPDDWELYVIGYKKAGDVLVNHLKEPQREQHALVFPIVFLYRQYIELRLKRLIMLGKELTDETPDFPKTHKLDELWHACKTILAKVESSPQEFEAIDEMIAQFCSIDPNSIAFRYPTTIKGDKTIPSDIKRINLRQVSEVLEKTANFLESAAMMISVYLDNKHEMEREFRDDYGGDY